MSSAALHIHRTIANQAKATQPRVRRLAARLLRARFFRRLLNNVEERAGHLVIYPKRDFRVSDLADFLFHTTDVPAIFPWQSRFADTRFAVPVDPAFPHPAPHNDPWGPATYWRREENRKIRQFYQTYLRRRPAGTFLDVGANWGHHSYPFAASGYRCVAFEPQSICCDFIERVRELNGLHNLTIVRSAVGSRYQSDMPFFESEIETLSSVSQQHVEAFHHPWHQRHVECVTLDSYCRTNAIAPTFIKIDTEGFESEVIRGALDVLHEYKPALVVEMSAQPSDQLELWSTLQREGYRCYAIVQSLSRPYPERPFVPVRDAEELLTAGIQTSERFEGDRDLVFLQPADDVLFPSTAQTGVQ